ncbi:PAS-domain containing protein [Rhodobacteraceae bacterium]|nr:PAS-domain containing protein [Paracoccaceae bacterium]
MLNEPNSLLMFLIGIGVSSLLAVAALARIRVNARPARDADETLIFLVRDKDVVDASFDGRRILDAVSGPTTGIEKLRLYLSRHFDDAEKLVLPATEFGDLAQVSRDGQSQIHRKTAADTVRLKLSFVNGVKSNADDLHSIRAMENELETLRANTSAAPFLLWRQNPSGEITWVNRAYLDTVRSFSGSGADLVWPLPILFPSLQATAGNVDGEAQRIAVHGRGDSEDAWYDCHITRIGQDILCTAIPADEAVRSENRRREFTQTLTKTFAELAIGLAIFDRSRRLVLFNPALLDLTNLPTDFLTSRPSMVSFLDRLRENRVMPEPRDYRTWRAAIADLEAASTDGTYSETWSLPDGQTYHVTGRPHPDGAVALLFEDISAEMSLTRRFRDSLEQSQTVIDAVSEAVAVFSPTGQLVMTNAAYHNLWQTDPNASLEPIDLTEATRHWHMLSTPTPVWGDFREFAQMAQDREEWTASIILQDGRPVHCRFIPQKAGVSLALFQIQSAQPVIEQDLRQTA